MLCNNKILRTPALIKNNLSTLVSFFFSFRFAFMILIENEELPTYLNNIFN